MRLVPLNKLLPKFGVGLLAILHAICIGNENAAAADWHLALEAVPLSTDNSRFVKAYVGTGYGVTLSRQVGVPESAAWLEGRLHGSAQWLAAGGRYFVWGGPNLISANQGREVEINVRKAGLFLDGGVAYFQASEQVSAAKSLSGKGLGLVANFGFSYPLFWRFAAQLKAGTCNTLEAPLTTYYTTVGLDFTF